nr:YlzJ-like family protein [Metabacillus lacus]
MPQELIFPVESQAYSEEQIVTCQGISMAVRPCGDGSCEVVRILSSDPLHYLQSEFSPGQKLKMNYSI